MPGAIASAFLTTLSLHWIIYHLFSNQGEDDLFSLKFFAQLFKLFSKQNAYLIEYNLYPFIIALSFVYFGYSIAPKYKFKTAIILFVTYLITWSIVMLLILNSTITGRVISLRTILALSGACLGLLIVKLKSHQMKRVQSQVKKSTGQRIAESLNRNLQKGL